MNPREFPTGESDQGPLEGVFPHREAGAPDFLEIKRGEGGSQYQVVIDGQEIVFDDRTGLSREEAEREARLINAFHKAEAGAGKTAESEKPAGELAPPEEDSAQIGGLGEILLAAIKGAKTRRDPNYNGLNPKGTTEAAKDLEKLGIIGGSAKKVPQTPKTGKLDEKKTQENPDEQKKEYEDLIRKGRGKRTEDENARLKELGGLLGSNRQRGKPKDKPKPQTKEGNQWRGEKKEGSDRHRSVKHRGEGGNGGAAKPENVNSGLRGEILVLRNLERELSKESDPTKKETLLKKITIQKGRVYGLSKNTPASVPQSPKPNL
ncbi:MAG: hypothetical protein AAB428_00655 [Patescibacteria group bacterium]